MKNLINYQDHSYQINEEESVYDKYTKEEGEDFDHFNKLVVPKMKAAGFKRVEEPALPGATNYGTGYFCYPDHNTGVNLFLQTSLVNPMKYVVCYKGNQGVKEFGVFGTNADAAKAANAAIAYAISLKNKLS